MLVGIVAINVLRVFPLKDPRAINVLLVGYVSGFPFSSNLFADVSDSACSSFSGLPRTRILHDVLLPRHLRSSFRFPPRVAIRLLIASSPSSLQGPSSHDYGLPRRSPSQRSLRRLWSSWLHRSRSHQTRRSFSSHPPRVRPCLRDSWRDLLC